MPKLKPGDAPSKYQHVRRAALHTLATLGTSLATPFNTPSYARQTIDGESKTPEPSGWGTSQVERGKRLEFPRDYGSHPQFRTEWWYVTGFLNTGQATPLGFQLTFFRSKTNFPAKHSSQFAPSQLVFGHFALADAMRGKLLHVQQAERGGFKQWVYFSEDDCDLKLGNWRMQRQGRSGDESYLANLRWRDAQGAGECALKLSTPMPPVLQGENGFSQKGPSPKQASHYYSRPQLKVEAKLSLSSNDSFNPKTAAKVTTRGTFEGRAWMDHEWSQEVLSDNAQGWDWVGLHFDDGSSLMAFQIREKHATKQNHGVGELNSPPLWSEAHMIDKYGKTLAKIDSNRTASDRHAAVRFTPGNRWTSLRSGATYPVSTQISLRLEGTLARQLLLKPIMDDQEIDARASTGGFYWEGLVAVWEVDKRVGWGYLEMTGYAGALRL